MRRMVLAALLFALAPRAAAQSAAPATPPAQNAAPPHAPPAFHYLHPEDFAPQAILPPPPAPDSPAEALELIRIHMLVDAGTGPRMAQAIADAKQEDPGLFDAVLGRRLEDMPATWKLLGEVRAEAAAAIGRAKAAFARPRPYVVDPTIHPCNGTYPDPDGHRSYPSGHSSAAYSVGWVLARLVPAKAAAVLDRARDYALSREICGMHFHSDTEAARVIATLVADRMLADWALRPEIAAARRELAAP